MNIHDIFYSLIMIWHYRTSFILYQKRYVRNCEFAYYEFANEFELWNLLSKIRFTAGRLLQTSSRSQERFLPCRSVCFLRWKLLLRHIWVLWARYHLSKRRIFDNLQDVRNGDEQQLGLFCHFCCCFVGRQIHLWVPFSYLGNFLCWRFLARRKFQNTHRTKDHRSTFVRCTLRQHRCRKHHKQFRRDERKFRFSLGNNRWCHVASLLDIHFKYF